MEDNLIAFLTEQSPTTSAIDLSKRQFNPLKISNNYQKQQRPKINKLTHAVSIKIYPLEQCKDIISYLQLLTPQLDLSQNDLTSIPPQFCQLKSLGELNLSGNSLQDLYTAVQIIGNLPNLHSLFINLNTQQDVQAVIVQLQNLTLLNGLQIDRDQLKKTQQDQEEDDEQAVGEDQKDAFDDDQQVQVIDNDGSQNGPFQGHQNDVQKQDVKPKNFQSDVFDDEEPQFQQQQQQQHQKGIENYIDEENKIIETQNQSSETRNMLTDIKPGQQSGISVQQFEQIAIVFDSIRTLSRQFQPHKDRELEKEYEQHFQKSLNDLKSEPANNRKPLIVRKNPNQLPQIKLSFYDLCAKHFLNYLQIKDPSAAAIFQNLQNSQNKIFGELLASTPEKIAPSIPVHNSNPQTQRRMKALQQLADIYQDQKQELKKQCQSLQEQNKKLMNMLVKRSKGGQQMRQPGADDQQQLISPQSMNYNQNLLNQGADNHQHQVKQKKFLKNLNLTGSIGPTGNRSLTLKQLRDVVTQIYQQKIKYDQKCEQSHLPRQTMEQFMYTFLNQRYGLKNLIIEWATAIINGIRRFSRTDHDVALFGKIMRNQCDEQFRFIQIHVKETIVNLMKAYLKQRYIHKNERDISRIIQQIKNGSIEQWLWRKIIDKMYDSDDCIVLEKACYDMMKSAIAMNDKKNKMSREEYTNYLSKRSQSKLVFKDFQKAVLDFQLHEHQKFLKKFVDIFRQFDTDGNGVISESEFRLLASSMQLQDLQANVEYFLQIIDPYNNKQMTFSEIVHLFSAHMVPLDDTNPQQQVALLQKFARN